jgi:Protein of unknown function (DUF2857)
MSTKEADLINAVLTYVSRCIAQGDVEALQRMRLGPEDIALFAELRVADLERFALSQPHRHFLDIAFKPASVRRTLMDIGQLRQWHELKLALIRAEAPRAMMATLFNMDNHEYAALHASLALPYAGGRPCQATDEESVRLWEAWRRLIGNTPFTAVTPEQYVALHRETGLSLRIIWPLVTRWFAVGQAERLPRRPSVAA